MNRLMFKNEVVNMGKKWVDDASFGGEYNFLKG